MGSEGQEITQVANIQVAMLCVRRPGLLYTNYRLNGGFLEVVRHVTTLST